MHDYGWIDFIDECLHCRKVGKVNFADAGAVCSFEGNADGYGQ